MEGREMENLLDYRQCDWKLHYLIQWARYNHTHMSWETAENIQNQNDLVNQIHQKHSNQQQD